MPSTYNPSGSNSNCFFVTLAYLLGLKSVDQLPPAIHQKMQDSPDGVYADFDMKDVKECLGATGRKYRLKQWLFKDDGSEVRAGTAMCRNEQFLLSEWQVPMLGVGYVTTKGVSHFVVLKDGHPPKYVCYQNNSNGKDVWGDVKRDWTDPAEGNKVVCAFALVADAYSDPAPGEVLSHIPKTGSGKVPSHIPKKGSGGVLSNVPKTGSGKKVLSHIQKTGSGGVLSAGHIPKTSSGKK